MIKPETTVREIVAHHPETLEVFDQYRIDYCCGAGEPLAAAAERRGVDLARLTAELEEAIARPPQPGEEGRDWTRAELTELVEHLLETHHAFLKKELPRLQSGMDTVARVHGPNHGEVLKPLKQTFGGLRLELEAHLQKEEEVLFPMMREIGAYRAGQTERPVAHCGSIQNPIEVMLMEHDSVGTALARMHELTSDYTLPEDACMTFEALYQGLQALEADLHRHIHLENNILFPRAVTLEGGDAEAIYEATGHHR